MPRAANTIDSDPAIAGGMVARYVVLDEVGRGGMGRVLRAYDPKLQREVAIKEVKAGSLDGRSRDRLVAEARAMAQLSHENVVAVFDVEELASGEVVLVMEYVAGATLRAWLRERARPWHEVIACFVAAGRGLAAAHAAMLLHRDFKPANVLVGVDAVKVTDFGLAKGESWGDTSGAVPISGTSGPLTTAGTVLGTPRYMAPEQHRGAPLTASADQFAFCVALWEALCGEPPFSGDDMGERKHDGPPPWPNRDAAVPTGVVAALTRGLDPRPDARWPDMESLLRALAEDPARRRAKRRTALAAFTVAGVAVVGVGSWGSATTQRCSGAEALLAATWDPSRRAAVEAAYLDSGASFAPSVWTRTAVVLDQYAVDWADAHRQACEATDLGQQRAEVLDRRMACLHRARRELAAVTELLTEADAAIVRKSHEITGTLRPVEACSDIEALRADVVPPRPEERAAVEAARAELAAAEATEVAGRYEQARAHVEVAKERLAGVAYGPVNAERSYREGVVLHRLGDYRASELALRHALAHGLQSRTASVSGDAATQLMYVVGRRQERFDLGLAYAGLAQGLAQGDPLRLAHVYNDRGAVLDAQGNVEEAVAMHRRALELREQALEPGHRFIGTSRNNLASALAGLGRHAEAEAQMRLVVSSWEAALGPDHPDVGAARNNLANALSAQGKNDEAEVEQRLALAIQERALGPDHPIVGQSLDNLSALLHARGKLVEAEDACRRGLAISLKAKGPDSTDVAMSRSNLGMVLQVLGRFEESQAELQRSVEIFEAVHGPDHPHVAIARSNLAIVLKALGRLDEAETAYAQALAFLEPAFGADHPDVAQTRTLLANLLLERGRADEALPLAEQSWRRQQADDVLPTFRAQNAFVLAAALWDAGRPSDRARALALADRSLQDCAAAGPAADEFAAQVRTWLQARRR